MPQGEYTFVEIEGKYSNVINIDYKHTVVELEYY
jgi:hypothetical protein